MKYRLLVALLASAFASSAIGAPVLAPPAPLAANMQPYVRVPAGHIALAHVRVIVGTGAAPVEDRTVLIDGARIAAVQAGTTAVPRGYQTIDLTGATIIPGLVGMHNHVFYLQRPNIDASGASEDPLIIPQMTFS